MKAKLDEQTRELIAIGASIGANCQPCLTYHAAKAKEVGVPADWINQAVSVGFTVQAGATAAMQEFAKRALAALMADAAAPAAGRPQMP